jgi:glycosyltransferase involved in cell wall biosynthesis
VSELRRRVRQKLPPKVVKAIRRTKANARKIPRTKAEFRVHGERFVEQRVIGTPTGRRALRAAWRTRTAFPIADDELQTRIHLWGHRLARRGHVDDAIALYAAAEPHLRDPDLRAKVLVQRTQLELRHGDVPADIWQRTQLLLDRADASVARGDLVAAGARLQEGLNLVYNRLLHFEHHMSPLSADPDAFLAPFRASTAWQGAARWSPKQQPKPPAPTGRPRRLLFVTFLNWSFVNAIVDDYRATPNVEVRTLDLKEIPNGPWRAQPIDILTRRVQAGLATDPVVLPDDLREPFDWADTIFVEWGHRSLPWVSLLPDLRARVVARIHSFEAFTPMPLHTDWSRIDDLIFVSPHIRALVEACIPNLSEGPRIHTIPNRNVFAQYQRPKLPGSEWTLGMIGYDNLSKDPAWTLDVLEELRRVDPRWRLVLLGRDFPRTNITGAATAYRDRFEQRLADLGDAVQRPGFTDDVPEALRQIGVIVSSSRREGTHEGLLQGVASGAYPIVRNWPYVARWGGPATLMPAEWVVEEPAEAAARLLTAAADPQKFDAEREAAADWITSRYDWSVVRPALDALMLEDAP